MQRGSDGRAVTWYSCRTTRKAIRKGTNHPLSYFLRFHLIGDDMQTCKKCGIEKPLDEFHKDKSRLLGVTSICKPCAIAKSKAWLELNKAKHKDTCKAYREKHKERLLKTHKEWAENNANKIKQHKAKWKRNNPDAVRRHAREAYYRNLDSVKARKKKYLAENKDKINAYAKKRREAVDIKLNTYIGNGIRQSMQGKKQGTKWLEIVGYSVKDLREHLESLFVDGMSWENYGEWHIDHIRPIASFDFSDAPFNTAKECWRLENLQPLWAIDNLRKGAKW